MGSLYFFMEQQTQLKQIEQYIQDQGIAFLIDKPFDWTSTDVVRKLKILFCKFLQIKKIKIGHAGTLDPLASGLLIICVGKATKKIDSFMGLPKTYMGEFVLGATTPSYDLETQCDQFFEVSSITADDIQETAKSFVGEISQIPPIYSAIMVEGKRAYELARLGVEHDLKSRKVLIDNFEVNSDLFPIIQFKVACSKGTYIRSLVHDFGKKMNNGAYLQKLIRTKIGYYSLENALNIHDFDVLKAIESNLLEHD
jgi:tRNA pseudouridine55 synthase